MHRVKVEIGRQFSPAHHLSQTPTSPLQQNPMGMDFASPRKRFLQEFDNLSPAAKRHRLSTDSRGSGGSADSGAPAQPSNGGTGSPHLFMHPGGVASSPPRPAGAGHGNQPYRMSSFSIDSIISSSSREDRPDNGSPMTSSNVISSPKPIKPVALTPRRSPVTSQHSNTPLVVPITPYTSRGLDPRTPLDPRLAHLAGVAADPRLGLSPAASMGFMMNPYYSQYLATASHLAAAAAAGLWRPPPQPSPSLATSPAPRSHSTASSSSTAMPSTSTPPPPTFSPWGQQYRGEPRVDAPVRKEQSQSTEQPMDTGAGNPCFLSFQHAVLLVTRDIEW